MSGTMSMEIDEQANVEVKNKKTNGKKPQKKTTKRKRKVKKWSKVWLDFDEQELEEGETDEDVKAQFDELPFSFVERDGFRHYSRINQPLFDVPCRATTTTDCYKLYDEEKIKLLDVIQKNIGRLCLTTDSWTSLGKKSYMSLTGHFIDNEWKLKKKILNFCRLDGHSGVDIGKGVESCVNEWGIDAILSISVDNAMQDGIRVIDKSIANIRIHALTSTSPSTLGKCSNLDDRTTNPPPPTRDRLRDKMNTSSTSTSTISELDKYLGESVKAFDSNVKFDILA
ncbi:zinc finger BED domain-containing protein RICESLEEPER 2-like protein [Tanacetum coccineum]|uniref:Zinc finger BED domain-containing protein RICESLEEPER 2-like protein n=1 Tax=Tanacetum coccineum TaxID=301880 RepID=A0ABQ5F0A5_9ASTR